MSMYPDFPSSQSIPGSDQQMPSPQSPQSTPIIQQMNVSSPIPGSIQQMPSPSPQSPPIIQQMPSPSVPPSQSSIPILFEPMPDPQNFKSPPPVFASVPSVMPLNINSPSSQVNSAEGQKNATFDVTDCMRYQKSSGQKDSVAYGVEVRYLGANWKIYRKYDDFELLEGAYKRDLKGYKLMLPENPANYKLVKFESSFMEERRKILQEFMKFTQNSFESILQGRLSKEFLFKLLIPSDKRGDQLGTSNQILSFLK